ncbi:HBS1 Elongation factor 1 alpha-like protein [Candida maltosa Xu316]
MDYDEDDIDYNSQEEVEEFDENNLNNEEYDLLHDILPELKKQVKEYDIPEHDMKEALYYNYFEIEPTIEELKSKYKKTQLAKARAKQREETQSVEVSEVPKPTSKLSALAKARSQTSSSSVPKSIAILDRLTSTEPTKSPPVSKPLIFTKKLRKESTPTSSTTSENASSSSTPQPQTPVQQIIFDVSLDNSILLNTPKDDISVFWFENKHHNHIENEQKRRRLYDSIFQPVTNLPLEKITKAKESFTKPSPDDVVLQAQKQVFEGVSNLKITETPKKAIKETKPFKKIDISNEILTSPNYSKPRKSFVVIGHVDAGKSTLMGRLLYDFGIVDAKTVNKLVKEAEKAGKGSFALAWIMDQTEEERSHGVTVDICATDFETDTTKFTAIDAPGHKDFVPQMIGGVSQADFALLVVDSITGEFEAGFALDGQTKEHTILAKNFGIEKICVAINKMDKEDWDQHRFETIKSQMLEFLTGPDVEFDKSQVDFIPISGLTGNNVVKRDPSIESFNWYHGPTLGEYIEKVELESSTNKAVTDFVNEPFFLSVHDVYKDKGELKVSGKISGGVISAGETIVALPSEESLQVQSLKVSKKNVDFAIRGELVQISFKSNQLSNESVEQIRIGDLITKPGSPVKVVQKFVASLHLFNMDKPLLVGMPFVLFRNNTQVPARITQIVEILDSTKKKKKKLLHLVSKQNAIVEIEIDGAHNSLPLTKYEDNKILGRIVIRREGVTVGAGKVVDLVSK